MATTANRLPSSALLALPLVLALLCPSPGLAATRSVTVGNDVFAPKTVTVARDDTVRWVWRSRGRKHNVASPAFGDSGNHRRGTFEVRFTRTGRYQYFCYLHGGMSGTVVVRR
ncbi:MAG TPA: plastocyanin/azurin family copper-binding protein [Conexibacter sp.]|jgi:plastocyanin|nr:plastocyanin/azurin family copper-binding protein [Conexibacter sp.]